jgi:hypothetical protein
MTKILVILACNYILTCLNKQSVSSQSITIFSKSGGSLVQSSKKIIHENIHACELNHMVCNMIIRVCQVGYPWGTCKHLYSYHRGSVCPIEYNLHGAATNDVHPACMLKPRPTTEFNTVATWPSTSSRTYARSLVGHLDRTTNQLLIETDCWVKIIIMVTNLYSFASSVGFTDVFGRSP